MAIRNIIHIDLDKCDGCGKCAQACAEGAIEIIDGKARLIGEILCDGFGACLGSCPQGALTIEKREAEEYSEEAVEQHLSKQKQELASAPLPLHPGCPGSAVKSFPARHSAPQPAEISASSELRQWPVQLMLVPPTAPYLKDSRILVCADCVPFAIPDFHSRYLKDHVVLVGCPKLDNLRLYFDKLKEIFNIAHPLSITVLKMEVPCCNGIAQAALTARDQTASSIPLEVHTIGISGGIEIHKADHTTAPGSIVP